MPPIKSINEPRPLSVEQQKDYGAPKILTQAIPEPPKPTETYFSPDRIVGMILWQERLYVATENGVYVNSSPDGAYGFFRRLKFEIVEEPNES